MDNLIADIQVHVPIEKEEILDLRGFDFIKKRVKKLPYEFVKKKQVLPIEETTEHITVALVNPENLESLEELRFLLNKKIKEVLCTKEALEKAIEICYHQSNFETRQYFQELKKNTESPLEDNTIEEYDLLSTSADAPAIRLLNMILSEAIVQKASDIHFEPTENELSIRFRVDGILQKQESPPFELSNQLITRIKILAKLDITEQRLPQDGRIKLSMVGRKIDFRVSTIPTISGERVVLRVLDRTCVVSNFDSIGMNGAINAQFKSFLFKNQGIILVTGPTGSGKTTTLYSAINVLEKNQINIMTVEDPVEYKIKGISQLGINPKVGLTFSKGLKHILRQDPDVILIGEIRDKETAEIAIQSALTGHLVLSTLHTNDAASALTRLVDMGIEPYLLSSTVLVVLAQRLVRKICDSCKYAYHPSENECNALNISSCKFYKGRGCSKCFHTGYKGRVGIYELMVLEEDIKKQLLKSADARGISEIASKLGMLSLRHQGAQQVIKGVTTSSEVIRVTK